MNISNMDGSWIFQIWTAHEYFKYEMESLYVYYLKRGVSVDSYSSYFDWDEDCGDKLKINIVKQWNYFCYFSYLICFELDTGLPK